MIEARPRTGGQILIDQLRIHGVDIAFCVPGESYLAALDALYDARDEIRLITCRQEGGATYMAEAYGKLTGRPGIAFVTRGPGATNASIGVHTAFQNSTPLILFVGQAPRAHLGRQAFQEIDYRQMFGPLTKWTTQVEDPARLPELVARAFQTAVSGRPGPVVIALPEDVLRQECVAADARPYSPIRPHPGSEEMRRLGDMLVTAQRPIMVVGGGGWSRQGTEDMLAFAEANQIPTGTSFRRQDLVDNRSPCYAGMLGLGTNPAFARHVREADLVILAGTRPDAKTADNYTLLNAPPDQRLVHIHPDVEELGRIYQADLYIVAGMPEFAAAARTMPPVSARWQEWTGQARRDFEAEMTWSPRETQLDIGRVVAHLRSHLPEDTIVTSGGGNYTVWCQRYWTFSSYPSQLGTQAGGMGYGIPAAVAAKLVCPQRQVVAFAGDGCFLMNGQELATAMQYGAPVLILIVNNGMFGTIAVHQERQYPGRAIGNDLRNPDFAAYARAFGAHGEVVERTEQFPPALERALASNLPAVIELRVPPEVSAPGPPS